VKGKVSRGSMREMRDDETVWLASVFMQDHEVGEFFGPACACDFVNNMISAVNPRGIWDYETHFLESTESENVGLQGVHWRSARTFENWSRRLLGSRLVVMRTRGSRMPML